MINIHVMTNKKKEVFRKYINNGKLHSDYERLQSITTFVDCLKSSNEKYIQLSTKVKKSFTSAKTYWHILKTFVNGKKIHVIPPLVDDKFVSTFFRKSCFQQLIWPAMQAYIKKCYNLTSHTLRTID